MNNHTKYLLILNIIAYTVSVHGMEIEREVNKVASQEKIIVDGINQVTDEYSLAHAQQTKEQILQAQINKRKWFNLLYGATTLVMIGTDIANSYWSESGLLTQDYRSSWNVYTPCTCPNQTAWCNIKTGSWNDPRECTLTDASRTLYLVNDSMTMYRFYSGLTNLCYLYQTQQSLNTLTVTEKNTKHVSFVWRNIQGVSSGIIGTIAGVAGVVNGIKNYPRTVAIWGINAAVDALGAFNWHQNMNACDELLAQTQNENDGDQV